MAMLRWDRTQATGFVDPLAVDELAGHLLVLDGVTAADEPRLAWCRRAPCPVVGVVPAGGAAPDAVDAAVGAEESGALAGLAAMVERRPAACRVLVEVLRAVPSVDVPTGLALESFAYSTLLGGEEFAEWLTDRPRRSVVRPTGAPLRLEREGDGLRITLTRPERRNSFSAEMRDALFEALVVAELDEGIDHVLIDAEGPVFSSGGELTEFGTTPDPVRAQEIRSRRSVGALLARLGPRVTVRVHGACVGAGVELPAFAHRVVAAPDTTFRLPEVGMGLIPGAGGTVSITRRIGRRPAARLAISGEQIDAAEACSLGLVDEVSA